MRLQVYVSQHCESCSRSAALGNAVASYFDDVTVEVIDLDAPSAIKPDSVFAVPTFLLEGQLLCLGNQEEAWLTHRLQQIKQRMGEGAPHQTTHSRLAG
jgi:hypothetical protein